MPADFRNSQLELLPELSTLLLHSRQPVLLLHWLSIRLFGGDDDDAHVDDDDDLDLFKD